MDESKKQFARSLIKQINIKGKTQKEIAEAIGVAPTTFNNWVKGISEPSLKYIDLMCEYFSCDADELLGKTISAELNLTADGIRLTNLLKLMSPLQQRQMYEFGITLMKNVFDFEE